MPKLKKKSYEMRRQNIQLVTDSRANESCESLDRKRKAEERDNETLTQTQKKIRQTLDKERTAKARENETLTHKITRQTLDKKRTSKAHENETLTHKITRQTSNKVRTAKARDNETLTQKLTRQTLDKEKTAKRRKLNSQESSTFDENKRNFDIKIQCGPMYACNCCHRLLYKHSVIQLNIKNTQNFLHLCIMSCFQMKLPFQVVVKSHGFVTPVT